MPLALVLSTLQMPAAGLLLPLLLLLVLVPVLVLVLVLVVLVVVVLLLLLLPGTMMIFRGVGAKDAGGDSHHWSRRRFSRTAVTPSVVRIEPSGASKTRVGSSTTANCVVSALRTARKVGARSDSTCAQERPPARYASKDGASLSLSTATTWTCGWASCAQEASVGVKVLQARQVEAVKYTATYGALLMLFLVLVLVLVLLELSWLVVLVLVLVLVVLVVVVLLSDDVAATGTTSGGSRIPPKRGSSSAIIRWQRAS